MREKFLQDRLKKPFCTSFEDEVHGAQTGRGLRPRGWEGEWGAVVVVRVGRLLGCRQGGILRALLSVL